MIFETKNYIPEVYGKERDMNVFTKLIDMVVTNSKYTIDNMRNLYDANKCKDAFLPLLGDTLNYKYNYQDTVSANRKILDYFTIMEKNRGSVIGLKMATALSLTSLNIAADNNEIITTNSDYLMILNDLEITFDYEEATITIKYPNVYTLVRYLMDYVRPVGMYLNIESISDGAIDDEAMFIYAATENVVREYNPKVDSGVNTSKVNFALTDEPTWIDLLEGSSVDFNE